MFKTSFRVIIVSIVVLLSLFILLFVLIRNDTFPFNIFFPKTNDRAKQSVFNPQPLDAGKTTLDINFNKYGGELKDQPDGEEIFGLGTSLVEFDYDATWDYTRTPFWAKVKKVSIDYNALDDADEETLDDKTLVLNFMQPQSMPYLGKDVEVKVVGCTKGNSFLRIDAQQINAVQIDFWNEVEVGNDMVGYCLNQECTQVGKLCKLYRY